MTKITVEVNDLNDIVVASLNDSLKNIRELGDKSEDEALDVEAIKRVIEYYGGTSD